MALIPTFTDIAAVIGVNQNSKGFGPNPVDINRDGIPELLFLNHVFTTSNLFYRQANGSYLDTLPPSGITYPPGFADRHGACWGDYNNDGWLELYNSLGSNQPNRLWHPASAGLYTEVSGPAGVADAGRGRGSAWVDYDRDGWLDLHITNAYCVGFQDRLFHNNGNGTFTDVSASAGDLCTRFHRQGASWADFNNDGFPDCFAGSGTALTSVDPTGLDAKCNLYRNNGNETFTDVTTAANIIREPCNGAVWGDYDNDGFLDLFVTATSTNRLYHNNGNGTFTELGKAAGVSQNLGSQDAIWIDVNNDGYLDLYVVNSGANAAGGQPNQLFVNNGNGTFTECAATAGAVGDLGVFGSVAVADVDADGNPDIFITRGVAESINGNGPHIVYRNNGTTNKWLRLTLVGTRSNSLGIGAVARLTRSDGLVLTRPNNGGCHQYAQDDMTIHFGLGTATISNLTVTWPSGLVQAVSSPSINQTLTVVEA
jgi:hypothetical protein